MNLLVYAAVRYTFKPVSNILAGLVEIEQGQYASRLPIFEQPELKDIGEKFNVMADTLQQSAQNNHRLTNQIINVQEDERKSLARDIHDEIGQYLTAIHVDASTILNAKKISTAKTSAKEISSVTQQMMLMVQDLLQRLRPRIIDELGVGLALGELVHNWESLTNIAKHAQAKNVDIEVVQDNKEIHIKIKDDGVGFDQTKMSRGYGLAGMRERIQGLLGEMEIKSSSGTGTKIYVTLPITTSFVS